MHHIFVQLYVCVFIRGLLQKVVVTRYLMEIYGCFSGSQALISCYPASQSLNVRTNQSVYQQPVSIPQPGSSR